MTDAIQKYSELVDLDTLRHYHDAICGTNNGLPFIDESGNLTYLDPVEITIRHNASKINPETARRIARYRPQIEAMLEGKEEEPEKGPKGPSFIM